MRNYIKLAEALVKECAKHGNKAYFYGEKDGKRELCYLEDATEKVEKIKSLLEQGKKYVYNFDHYLKDLKYLIFFLPKRAILNFKNLDIVPSVK